ncbi:DUF1194 domain-containing protein [Pannus brasiliensis CCIBt3594]|uniref:DUF1194 domain-containing protein n=1 Tax=Pannus brasiliensis CCIBt3594 TaxID=1427578 RepID=A0AAW9QIR7_9CHRO
MKKLCLLLLSTALVGWADRAWGAAVDIELAILMDTSSSVPPSEYAIQRQAYINTFSNNFYNQFVAPLNGVTLKPGQVGTGRIAVNIFTFGTVVPSTTVVRNVGWAEIASQADATAFANQIAAQLSYVGGRTPIGDALQTTADSMFNNTFDPIYSVIDISSDGQNVPTIPAGLTPRTGSNYARCKGLTNTTCVSDPTKSIVAPGGVDVINAIAILPFANQIILQSITYGNNLSGNPNHIFPAADASVYEETLAIKLGAEIGAPTAVPEPGLAFGLIGLGIFGVGKRCLSRRE